MSLTVMLMAAIGCLVQLFFIFSEIGIAHIRVLCYSSPPVAKRGRERGFFLLEGCGGEWGRAYRVARSFEEISKRSG
jgi:hypothetical protein